MARGARAPWTPPAPPASCASCLAAASGAVAVRGALAAVPAPAGTAPTDSSMPGMGKKTIVRGIPPRLAAATSWTPSMVQASAPPQRSTSAGRGNRASGVDAVCTWETPPPIPAGSLRMPVRLYRTRTLFQTRSVSQILLLLGGANTSVGQYRSRDPQWARPCCKLCSIQKPLPPG
jgi:hypothetical protein